MNYLIASLITMTAMISLEMSEVPIADVRSPYTLKDGTSYVIMLLFQAQPQSQALQFSC